ncbi:thioredoxin family protein [Bermanella marisrubri]|uniref:Thioredoxin domain-containing protein n=1 Tax=Bermanella marisrubri TaxID=207949 RepID=Q1N3P9_9GAMM|nr:thioredoxin family protein [Bermanella marisrubri]EAT12825.1 hypothetical protein RED65_12169 [Oceanobacter sp. RED65] [Bermanella marisrubri]QIZ83147.1 thioredoxin family protein [Bermanella marisrubri]
MFSKFTFRCVLLLFLIASTACMEDLTPSNDPIQGEQNRQGLQGTVLEDIALIDNNLNKWQLSQALSEADAVAFYFTMWCPVCDSHMQHIKNHLAEDYPNVTFVFVDYVSSSQAMSRETQIASGYQSSQVLADIDSELQNNLSASMSSFAIIDKNFVVRYNQVFQSDTGIRDVLDSF